MPRTRLAPLLAALAVLTACAERPPARVDGSASSAGAGVPRRDERPAVRVSPRAAPPSPAPVNAGVAPVRAATDAERARYAWLAPDAAVRPLDAVFSPPAGFTRVEVSDGSFGAFLRGLPLRAAGAAVYAHDGSELRGAEHPGVAAVAELDVSRADLQQCADSVIRLHAEWVWSTGRGLDAAYDFTSGDRAPFARYARGERAVIDGARVRWEQKAAPASDHAAYRRWLELVFTYAGTVSIAREGRPVPPDDVRPGDFFVLPGGPGHAILILDLARAADGRRMALLGQGFMPAQDFHVLRPTAGEGAWFSLDGEAVDTPFWPAPFPLSSLRRFASP